MGEFKRITVQKFFGGGLMVREAKFQRRGENSREWQ